MVDYQIKDYIVINSETQNIMYEGNNAWHAHQAFFALRNPKLLTKGKIQTAVINHITALSERLN